MGISTEVYRARIGAFNGNGTQWKTARNTKTRNSEINIKIWFLGLVIVTLLIVGGVEQNPRPMSEQKEIEFFEFIKKTCEKENKVKGALEIIQASLYGLQSAINLVSSKSDKHNKAVNDLADSMAPMQMTVDNVKLRLEQCEKKETKAQVAPKRNNLIIFGQEEEKNESHSATYGILKKFLKE
jgi:hypothetical protein